MSEKRIGIVRDALSIRSGMEDCVIIATDSRTIIAFKRRKATLKEGFKIVYGLGKPQEQLPADLESADLDALAAIEGNISVPHSSIQKLGCGKGIGGYGLWILYLDGDGKNRVVTADFVPPAEMTADGKVSGTRPKETRRHFAASVQEIFKRALPPMVSQEADWKL